MSAEVEHRRSNRVSETSVAAPGRICLIGEGADWMGGWVATMALPTLGVVVSAQKTPSGQQVVFESDVPNAVRIVIADAADLAAEIHVSDQLSYMRASLAELQRRGLDVRGLAITARSTLPFAGGLSSSAALCVATVQAVTLHLGAQHSRKAVAEIAYAAERSLGSPCGRMDQYAVTLAGNLVMNHRSSPPEIVRLHVAESIAVVVAHGTSTSRFVDQYPLIYGRWAAKEQSILRYLAATKTVCDFLTRASVAAGGLRAHDLASACVEGQRAIVADLGIVNPYINELVRLAMGAGAIGAKSAGARPTGGCMFALVAQDNLEPVVSALRGAGGTVRVCWLGQDV